MHNICTIYAQKFKISYIKFQKKFIRILRKTKQQSELYSLVQIVLAVLPTQVNVRRLFSSENISYFNIFKI